MADGEGGHVDGSKSGVDGDAGQAEGTDGEASFRTRLVDRATALARRYRDLLLRIDERPDWVLAGVFVGLGVLVMLAQYSFIYFGVQDITQFRVDARTVWRPLAREVLYEGQPLFGPDQFENKPPLWQFLNLGVEYVGPYYLLFYALTGVAHGVAAFGLFAWARRYGEARLGALAALLFLASVHAGFMARIDPRPYAAALVFVALLSSRATVAGASLAAATTMIQYAFFAVPVVIWRAVRDKSRREMAWWVTRFGAAGVAVAVVVFGAVGVVWGATALEYAVRYTVFMTADYTTTHSIFIVPVKLVGGHAAWTTELYAIVIPASLAVATLLADGPDWRSARGESALLAGSLMLPFLIRGHGMYWYSPLPFLALLAAFGLRDFFASDAAETRDGE